MKAKTGTGNFSHETCNTYQAKEAATAATECIWAYFFVVTPNQKPISISSSSLLVRKLMFFRFTFIGCFAHFATYVQRSHDTMSLWHCFAVFGSGRRMSHVVHDVCTAIHCFPSPFCVVHSIWFRKFCVRLRMCVCPTYQQHIANNSDDKVFNLLKLIQTAGICNGSRS